MTSINEIFKNLSLSASRAKIAYLSLEEIKDLWENHQKDKNIITYFLFNNVKECPKIYQDDMNTAYACSWIQDKTLYISYRGTEDAIDIITDIDLIREPLFPTEDKSILVHSGFLKYFQSLNSQIGKEILDKFEDIDVIHFQGHSLGASLSTIASCWYGKFYHNSKKIINHTIGSPRVGNNKFVKFYNKVISENIRIVNDKDPVTLFPISLLYEHVDNSIFLKEDGTEKKILKDINWFARLVFLPFEIYYRAPVSHHKCDLYINRLLKLANWDIKSLDYFIS
jgi:hypothetical protein